jgi:hypothetical protein
VHIGGHGLLKAGHHYIALDATPAIPNSRNALWTHRVAELLVDAGCDVVPFVDTCFAGASATALQQALEALATTPTNAGFGVVAGCRAFETAEDDAFVETLLRLMREGAHLRSLSRGTASASSWARGRVRWFAARIRAQDPLLGDLEPALLRNLEELDDTTTDIATLLRSALTATPGSPSAGLDVTELAGEVAKCTAPRSLFAHAAAR